MPSGQQTGTLTLINIRKEANFTMIDYLRGGTQMNLNVAIDFTGSNGDPKQPSSLHLISHSLNQYQQAILSIGQILLNYDHDKLVPTYGFGAVLKFPNSQNSGQVNHFFPCSGDFSTVSGYSVEGIFDLYTYCL